MRTNLILVALSSSLLFTSCKHYCRYSPAPVLRFSGFDSSSLKTVVLTCYNPDGTFTHLQNQAVFSSKPNSASDTESVYTSIYPSSATNIDTAIFLSFTFDAVIEIPALSKTYHIKNIRENRDTWTNTNCTNSMSYNMDGAVQTIPMKIGHDQPSFITITK